MIDRIACLICASAALSCVVLFVKTRKCLSYNNVWAKIGCLVSGFPKIKVKPLKGFLCFLLGTYQKRRTGLGTQSMIYVLYNI